MACHNIFLILVILSAKSNLTKASELLQNTNETVAVSIAQKVRVLCGVVMKSGAVVNTNPAAQSVVDTWGKRCNELLFTNEPPRITSNSPLSKDQHHFRFMYEKKEYIDWFLLSISGNSYIVVENLRYMLADHDQNDAIYFMLTVTDKAGISYVLSRKAVDLFINTDIQKTPCNTKKDDVVARDNCFKAIGLKRRDSQDFLQRDRFLAGDIYGRRASPVFGHRKFWDCRNLPEMPGDCYSDFAISLDDVDTKMKYVIDYLIYQLRPYGIKFGGKLPDILRQRVLLYYSRQFI